MKRLKVVSKRTWEAGRKKRSKLWRTFLKKPLALAGLPTPEMVREDHRYRVVVRFSVPKGVHPMSFDQCFAHVVGRDHADGAGTAFSKSRSGKISAGSRDMDFLFASRRDAVTSSAMLRGVLRSHRLKGKVEVFDDAWEPPRRLTAPEPRTRSTRRAGGGRVARAAS